MRTAPTAAFLATMVAALPALADTVVTLNLGDNVAEIVERAPEDATFHFASGIYRLQSVRPKRGQKFIGKGGGAEPVVFNGAVELSDWKREDGLWVAVGPPARGEPAGKCRKEVPLCSYNEDLFVDGRVYRRVVSKGDVRPGTFHDDGVNIYLADAPAGRLIEFGARPFAFSSTAGNVLIRDIVVEKYAAPAQNGAIEFHKGWNWRLENVVVRWNHGVGARVGSGAHITGGSFSHNGQLGIGGGDGVGIRIENAEIAHNNYAGFRSGWEAGGTKFIRINGLVVRNACIHNNDGPGLWTDIDNINVEIAGNRVFENQGDGIKHEISYRAKIHGNTVARNGHPNLNWLWGSQILIQNSRDVEVFGNVVEVGEKFGNGISVINQRRGKGTHGAREARNNYVHDNTIIHLGASGMSGLVADHGNEWFDDHSGNRFERNTYVVPNDSRGYFAVKDGRARFSRLADYGMEKELKVQVAARKAMKLECGGGR